MFARSSIIHAYPSFIDEGLTHVRDVVMPTLADMAGCAGMSMLVDRDGGRCIITSSWLDADTLSASEDAARALRDHATEIFHATADTSRWEVAAVRRDHRAHRRAGVRATWLRTDPAEVDRMIDTAKLVILPALEDLDGFCSASLMVDHDSGRAVCSTGYDNRSAMRSGCHAERALWHRLADNTAAEVLEDCEFDLAIAHLNVPELA